MSPVPRGLRRWLVVDGIVTGANALAYLAVAAVLAPVLGLPVPALLAAGGFLAAFTLLVAITAARPRRGAVLAVVVVNAAWAIGSLVLAATGAATTLAGSLWIVAQAIVVALFAILQWRALRGPVAAVQRAG